MSRKDLDKNDWSPWGDAEGGFLKLPHNANQVLAYLGFSSSEILVVQGFMSWVRQEKDTVSVTQKWLSEYAGVVVQTVVRATNKMVEMGMEVIACGAVNRLSNEYYMPGFIASFQKASLRFKGSTEERKRKEKEKKEAQEKEKVGIRTSLLME